MTTLERVRPDAAVERPTVKQWLSVAAVALGVFIVITAEMLPVGLLTPIGADLGVSTGVAGLMITVPGLVAAVAAPVSTVLTGRADRRRVLLALAALVAFANLGSALATDFGLMLAARILVGISIGGFWSIAGGIALRLVPEAYVPRATALVYGGIGAATVLGIPAGTFIGGHLGWRAALAALAALSLAVFAAIAALVPKLPSTGAVRFASLTRMVRADRGVLVGLALTFLIVSGHFVAYTYIRAILNANGIAETAVSGLLMVFGVAALLATLSSGRLIGSHLRPTLVGLATAMSLGMALMSFAVGDVFTAAAVLVLWGIGYGMVSPAVQTWYLRAAPREAEAATSLNTMMFNLSIATGSFVGGLVLDAAAARTVLWIGALLLVPAALLVSRTRPE